MKSREFQDRLADRARRAGVDLPAPLAVKLETYFRLLATWNQKINLAGMELADAAPATLDRLLIEPLAAARHVPVGDLRMIDIGSGGGSPAIPLALAVPGMRLLMVESRSRKSVFLREAVRAVELKEAEVETARYQALLGHSELSQAHDLMTLRAVRAEASVIAELQTFVKPLGLIFVFGSETMELQLIVGAPHVGSHSLVASLHSRLHIYQRNQ